MRRPLWALLLVGTLGLSCDSSSTTGTDQTTPVDVIADNDTLVDPGVAPDVARELGVDTVTGATKLILDNTHSGWGNPKCWDCHTADEHNDGKDPYLCIGCHGKNGAPKVPAGHSGTPPCSGCHTPHSNEGFPDPLSCQSCHVP